MSESPFHTKGLVYLGARDFYAERVPGGPDAITPLLPEELQRFWNRSFFASSKYDILPIVPISRAAARIAEVSHRDLVMENARWVAHRDIHGIYRLLLKLASPRQVALRLPKLSMQYFDFGTASAEPVGNDAIIGRHAGVPTPLATWMTWVVEGFATVALTVAGATDVKVRVQSQSRDGDLAGVETSTLVWHMRWSG